MIMRSRAQEIAIILSKYRKKSGARKFAMTSSGELETYIRDTDVEPRKGSWGDSDYWQIKGKADLLKSGPIAIKDLPDEMYHTTMNLPAVLSSGYLRGQSDGGGMGGGNGMAGVSFSTNKADALLTQTTLRREILMAQLPPDPSGKTTRAVLEKYARIDEQENFLPPGSLQSSVEFSMKSYDINVQRVGTKMKWVGQNENSTFTEFPKTQEEIEKSLRLLNSEAHGGYLQTRPGAAAKALGLDYNQFKTHPVNQTLKNPVLLTGFEDHWHKLKVEDVGIVTIHKDMLPKGALVRKGSDDFLSEIRVHADIPLQHFKLKSKKVD